MRSEEEMAKLAEDFDIGVLVGNKTFYFLQLLGLGKIKPINKKIKTEGMIVDFAVDQQNDSGFYFTEMKGSHRRLKVLLDKRISDIHVPFFSEHKCGVSIQHSGKYEKEDAKRFTIVLDAVDDDLEDV